MRRLLLAPLFVAVALFAAACASSSGPQWTYAPPTPAPSAAPSSEASAAPSGAASAAPSANASAAPSDGGAAGGDVVEISAINIAYEQTDVTAPADKPFTIRFDNKEAVPHNVEISDGSGTSVFKGDIVTGPKVTDYSVPALAAGTYKFHCTVHPNMVGTLTVGG
jgi:plastocyanin